MAMRLGSETSSLINHLHSRATIGQPDPVAGMGATILMWSDRHACTVFRVWERGNFRFIEVRRDHVKRTDALGMSDCQDYSYRPNVSGARSYFRRPIDDPSAGWRLCAENDISRWGKKHRGNGLMLGRRDEHYDFSF
jgi:hypothetical protein